MDGAKEEDMGIGWDMIDLAWQVEHGTMGVLAPVLWFLMIDKGLADLLYETGSRR